MADDEKAKAFFEFTNRGWTQGTRITWESLPTGVKAMWIERMNRAQHKKGNENESLEKD